MIPSLVTIINRLVDSLVIARDGKHLEKLFLKEVSEYGVEPTDIDYDNGYIDLEDATICMVWAEKPTE